MICVKPSYFIWFNLGSFALANLDYPGFQDATWSRRPLHYCLEDI